VPGFRSLIPVLLLGVAGALASGLAQAENYSFKFSTSQTNPNEPLIKVMHSFAQRVKERSKGQIELTVVTGDQLGAQKKVNEMIKGGARLMSATDYGQLGQILPDLGLIAGPYMFASEDDAKRLFASTVFKDMEKRLEAQGLKLVMADGLFGVRHLLANKPVRTPADIAGLTLRVPPAPVMLETFSALGARPTALPWGEVYNALQTGVVDAAEANYSSLAGAKLYEARKVISNTAHMRMYLTFAMNAGIFNKMPKDLQAILLEEGRRAGQEITAMSTVADAQFAEDMKKQGVQIVTDVDVKAFAAKARPAIAKVPGVTPGIYEKALAAMAH
jgi:tripartite ATP-independent transporter DctP family solute receptor